MEGIELRTANDVYMNEMKNFTTLIVDMVKKERLFASQGGPIILSQLNTCNGWYCDSFTPNNASNPKIWTENWSGWFMDWGGSTPKRTAEDLAFSVARFFQKGGSVQNYDMVCDLAFCFGFRTCLVGTTAAGPYITTTYDYNAPLDEYGNLNQPKYGHLTELHNILRLKHFT